MAGMEGDKMNREIQLVSTFQDEQELRRTLEILAGEHKARYLLAHADDGVIWGRFDQKGLTIAADVFEDIQDAAAVVVSLRPATLHQVRLFGPEAEILIWRTDGGFRARRLDEEDVPSENVLEEIHWLWGIGMDMPGLSQEANFTLMHEGQQGLRHAPPVKYGIDQRYGLQVHHHILYDDQGQAYIAFSRLVDLVPVEEANNGR
jgi:CRISPR-associated protein (TIGR03984 family)